MDNGNIVSFKIYLLPNNFDEPEIRRFGLLPSVSGSFNSLCGRIIELFPTVSGKTFTVTWRDEDGDEVAISSDDELRIALTSIKTDVKKLYLKIQDSGCVVLGSGDDLHVVHPGVFCDGCEGNIMGFRYKCLECDDYDLCSVCEHAGIHSEHPMLRTCDPLCIKRFNFRKMSHYMRSFDLEGRMHSSAHRRYHSHNGGHPDKKKRRSDKHESGAETGDESEEGCHKNHSHKKCKKPNKCPYSQIMSEVMRYFNPISFPPNSTSNGTRGSSERPHEHSVHMSHLRSVVSNIQKLLDPLGVNVQVDVRPKTENEDKKKEDKNNEHKKKEKPKESLIASSCPVESEQPRAPSVEEMQQQKVWKQKMDEITKSFSNQSMSSNNNSNNTIEEDGWEVFKTTRFEESVEETEKPRGRETAQVTSESKTNTKPTGEGTSQSQNLYPNLHQVPPLEPLEALAKILEMGFSNESNTVSNLLENKKGDISQVLEILCSQKKK